MDGFLMALFWEFGGLSFFCLSVSWLSADIKIPDEAVIITEQLTAEAKFLKIHNHCPWKQVAGGEFEKKSWFTWKLGLLMHKS